jgi:subtilisin family serine protease
MITRKISIILIVVVQISVLRIQVAAQYTAKMNWHLLDPANDKFMGASINIAYNRGLISQNLEKPLIVALIDGGVDIKHKDLRDQIWHNKSEVPHNWKDDDHNNYVDDINGWNYLGSPKGSFQYDNYDYIRELRSELKKDKNSKNSIKLLSQLQGNRKSIKAILSQMSTEAKNLEQIRKAISNINPSELELRNYKYKNFSEEKTLINLINSIKNKTDFESYLEITKFKLNNYREQLDYWLNLNYNPRRDDAYNEKFNGNSDVVGLNPYHATHIAGIIAAGRKNKIGSTGISDNVKIMILRTVPSGDYLDEDLAKAINYAVDNGAKVINISINKVTSPKRSIIEEAIKYAMAKDVLIVHSSGNQGQKLVADSYPTRNYIGGGHAAAWLEVGASTKYNDQFLLAKSSNYGKNYVDLLAPGVDIYSTTPNDTYSYLSGTSMAAPIVTGVAAVLRIQFPRKSAVEIKQLIMNSVYKIDHDIITNDGSSIPFSEVCLSGGIVNLLRALEWFKKK